MANGTLREDVGELAGQDRVVFIDSFDTMDTLLEVYPEAELIHPMLQPSRTGKRILTKNLFCRLALLFYLCVMTNFSMIMV